MRASVALLMAAAFAAVVAVTAQQSNTFWHNLNSGASTENRPMCMPYADPKTSRAYWIVDNTATWNPPTDCAWRAVNTTEKPPRTFYENFRTNLTQWQRPDALAWQLMDRSKPYFFNTVSNETTRITPPEMGFKDEERNATYYANGYKVTWDAPPEARWFKGYDEKRKRDYFWNPVLKESVWVVPAKSNLAWTTWYETIEDPVKFDL